MTDQPAAAFVLTGGTGQSSSGILNFWSPSAETIGAGMSPSIPRRILPMRIPLSGRSDLAAGRGEILANFDRAETSLLVEKKLLLRWTVALIP